MVVTPVATIAQGETTDAPRGLAEAPAEVPQEQVPVAPPTAVPPTAVPPTAVPTQVPPTAVPTQIPPTAVPTIEPTAVPTEKVWVNTDSLRVTDGVTSATVQQGGAATISITYNVTTPRTATTVYARLTGATDGWTISSSTLADTDPAATTASWTEASTLQPGTAFNLPIVITAPATVVEDHTVSLQVWSVAAGTHGQETGVAKTDLRVAQVTVLAPPPTPVPTQEPTAVPTQEPTAAPTMEPTVAPTTEPAATPTSEPASVSARAPVVPEPLTETDDAEDQIVAATPVAESDVDGRTGMENETDTEPLATPVSSRTLMSGRSNGTEPTIICVLIAGGTRADGEDVVKVRPGVEAEFECTFDNGPLKVHWNSDSGATGLQATVDGKTKSPTNVGNGNDRSFMLNVTATTCAPGSDPLALTFDFYKNPFKDDDFILSETLKVECEDEDPIVPTASIQGPVDFGTLTWNGENYGSAVRDTAVKVDCDGVCTDSYGVQISIEGAKPGVHPKITNASVSGVGIGPGATSGAPVSEPVTVARTSAGIDVDGTVDLELTLEPDDDAEPGQYDMTIHVTVVNGQ